MSRRWIAVLAGCALAGISPVWASDQAPGMRAPGDSHPLSRLIATLATENASSPQSVTPYVTSQAGGGNGNTVSAFPASGGLLTTLRSYQADGIFGSGQDSNIWQRLVNGFRISNVSRPRVGQWRSWFLQHQGKLEQILHNSRPFLYYVAHAVAQRGLPMELALLPAIESGYNPKAFSPAAAAGLWQFVPGTARNFGLQNTRWGDPRLSLTASTDAALDYLSYLYNYFGGDWLLAIASYNAGQGTVSAAIQQNVAEGKPTAFWDLSLPSQTENYVAELLALAQIIRNASAYHIALPSIANSAHIALVKTPRSVALNVAARLIDMPLRELKRLNAGLSYGVAPANYPLVVPTNKAETLRTALLTLPRNSAPAPVPVARPGPVPALRYVSVRSGSTLSFLAQQAGVSVSDLERWNHLRSARDLQIGQRLVVYGHGNRNRLVYAAAQRAIPAHITVHPGETLWQIAQRAHVSVGALAAVNGLGRNGLIHPGQTLRLPGQTHLAAISMRQERMATSGYRKSYVVRPGDTVWQIAQRFHVSPKSVIQWNQLASASDIHPGSRLTIYTR